MVKLIGFPDPGIVRAFKGNIDFYVVNGQNRARKWPQWTIPNAKRSPSVRMQQLWLAAMDAAFADLGSFTRGALQHPKRGGTWTTRDWFAKIYFSKLAFAFNWTPTLHGHSTPYPLPDPNNHYGAVLGSRLRLEPAGTQHLDLRLATPAPPALFCTNAAVHGLPTLTYQEFWYTRRGTPFRGGTQLMFKNPDYLTIMPLATSYGATYDITPLGDLSSSSSWFFQLWRYFSPPFDPFVWHWPLVALFPWPRTPPPSTSYAMPLVYQDFDPFYPTSPYLGSWPRSDPTFW